MAGAVRSTLRANLEGCNYMNMGRRRGGRGGRGETVILQESFPLPRDIAEEWSPSLSVSGLSRGRLQVPSEGPILARKGCIHLKTLPE
jgi:hypothetical protein